MDDSRFAGGASGDVLSCSDGRGEQDEQDEQDEQEYDHRRTLLHRRCVASRSGRLNRSFVVLLTHLLVKQFLEVS